MNNQAIISKGLLRRKVKHVFNLAALMAATSACRMELGEFFTSKKLSDDNRLFWQSYGGYLQANKKEHSISELTKYGLTYGKFKVEDLNKLRKAIAAYDIMSAEIKKGLEQIASAKKKLITWGELTDMAVGDLGMTINEYYESSLNEIMIRHMGLMRKQELQLKQTRLLMWEMRIKNMRKGQRIKPEQIFSLPSDDYKPEIKRMSKQEFLNLTNKWN